MRLFERLGLWLFGRLTRQGHLDVTLPDGSVVVIGDGTPHASLTIRDYTALRDVVQKGLTGFAESYMAGRIDTDDLRGLLVWGVANQSSWFNHPVARWTLPARRFWQKIVPERRHHRVRSMNDHYNLGNSFYEAWLDETMTYSSARFAFPDQALTEAQRHKYETIADGAGLERGMTVLEIGCGWGGFAEFAATERGCEVVAVTLSDEQAEYARKRMADAGITDRVDIRIMDFREVEGQFDAVVSIEMIESVDETHWPALFETIQRSLRLDARAAMQIITIEDSEWETYRSRADFIQQYIFPGGQIPAPKVLTALSRQAGLETQKVETFGLDYARTLSIWQANFESEWPALHGEHDLDERFRRMWNLYLTLCEAGFRMGRINVEQWVFARGDA